MGGRKIVRNFKHKRIDMKKFKVISSVSLMVMAGMIFNPLRPSSPSPSYSSPSEECPSSIGKLDTNTDYYEQASTVEVRVIENKPISVSPPTISLDKVIDAIIFVESSGRDDVIGDGGEAVGCLQIHRRMVRDVNRILGYKKFSYDDRKNRECSIEMMKIYIDHYNLEGPEMIARCWNGGPKGYKKSATDGYWARVEATLEEFNS